MEEKQPKNSFKIRILNLENKIVHSLNHIFINGVYTVRTEKPLKKCFKKLHLILRINNI